MRLTCVWQCRSVLCVEESDRNSHDRRVDEDRTNQPYSCSDIGVLRTVGFLNEGWGQRVGCYRPVKSPWRPMAGLATRNLNVVCVQRASRRVDVDPSEMQVYLIRTSRQLRTTLSDCAGLAEGRSSSHSKSISQWRNSGWYGWFGKVWDNLRDRELCQLWLRIWRQEELRRQVWWDQDSHDVRAKWVAVNSARLG